MKRWFNFRMKGIGDLPGLFLIDAKIKLSKAVTFRSDFFLGIFSHFAFAFLVPIFQFLIYANTGGYPDWSFNQILLYTATLLFWSGLTETLFGDIKANVGGLVCNGNFDRYLLYPYPPLWVLLTKGFNYRGIGTWLAGLVSIIILLVGQEAPPNLWQIAIFFLFIAMGILLYLALLIFYCTIVFIMVFPVRIRELFDRILMFSQFPAEVFSGMVRFVYFLVLPIALWVYFPSQALLGRWDNLAILSAGVGIMLFILSLIFWNFQVKKYASAGG